MSYDALKSPKDDFFSCDQSLYHSALEEIHDEKNVEDEGSDEENYYTYLHESRMNSVDYYSSL